jgi:hypothetical protein
LSKSHFGENSKCPDWDAIAPLIISRVNSPPLGAHEKSKKELQDPAACGGAVYFFNSSNFHGTEKISLLRGISLGKRLTAFTPAPDDF